MGGSRVGKDSSRVRTYGTYDELVAHFGVAEAALVNRPEEQALLRRLSHETFLAMSELATPPAAKPPLHRLVTRHVERLELDIDRLSRGVEPLHSFVLPRGGAGGAELHVARAVARRAERELWTLHREEPQRHEVLQWANRLSSLLFALALSVNRTAGFTELAPDYSV